MLTDLLAENVKNNIWRSNVNSVPLTIYLPNFSSMTVYVIESSSFDEVKRYVIRAHEQQKLQPPLHYHAPDYYELRMHDGKYLLCPITLL